MGISYRDSVFCGRLDFIHVSYMEQYKFRFIFDLHKMGNVVLEQCLFIARRNVCIVYFSCNVSVADFVNVESVHDKFADVVGLRVYIFI